MTVDIGTLLLAALAGSLGYLLGQRPNRNDDLIKDLFARLQSGTPEKYAQWKRVDEPPGVAAAAAGGEDLLPWEKDDYYRDKVSISGSEVSVVDDEAMTVKKYSLAEWCTIWSIKRPH